MIVEQFYLGCLSQASYLVADEATRRAVVVDPRRDISCYVEAAETLGVRIERVIETHVHADFLSGHLELAARTGAVISYGEAIGEVGFPIERLANGQVIDLGDTRLVVRATPGHTPESIVLVLYERLGSDPYGVLTGDTLLVGGVGRPDLVASEGVAAPELARGLFRSIHDELLTLPDSTLVFPAHGPGSACGKNLSDETTSTIGEQRRANTELRSVSEDDFVRSITTGQTIAPRYFAYDAALNRAARELLDDVDPQVLSLEEVMVHAAGGAVLLDTREPDAFATRHLRGAINVGLEGRFAETVGMVVEPDRAIVLVGDPATGREAKVRLARIGYDRVVGALDDLDSVLVADFEATDRSIGLEVSEVRARLTSGDGQVVDVRGATETADGVLPGARVIPLAMLTRSLEELDPESPVIVYCATGRRSATAASVLRASGFERVFEMLGGFEAWARSVSG